MGRPILTTRSRQLKCLAWGLAPLLLSVPWRSPQSWYGGSSLAVTPLADWRPTWRSRNSRAHMLDSRTLARALTHTTEHTNVLEPSREAERGSCPTFPHIVFYTNSCK